MKPISYVQQGIEQNRKDAGLMQRALIGGMLGVTFVVTAIGLACSPESAHHLVECGKNLIHYIF